MEPNFIIVESPDPIVILMEKFPELEDLQQDEEYGTYYVYNRFAEYLASQPEDKQLWQRAYDFFEMLAKGGSVLENLLAEVLEGLCMDSALTRRLKANVGRRPH